MTTDKVEPLTKREIAWVKRSFPPKTSSAYLRRSLVEGNDRDEVIRNIRLIITTEKR